MFAHYFGNSQYADVFRAGLRLPNLLQNLLGEGTLSASFIPVYAELLEQNRKEDAGKVAGAIFALLVVVGSAVSLLGIAFARPFVWLLVPGFDGERFELTVTVVRILFPMTATLVVSAWALGILNSHRQFFLSYVAPVVWNVAIVTGLVAFGTWGADPQQLVIVAAWSALVGGVLQLLVQLPSVLRLERSLQIRWDTKLEGVRETVRNAGPAIVGRGVVQLSGYIDMWLASLLAVGAVAALGYAQTLYILPVSLFGMSVAAAELPELARQRQGATEELRQRTNASIERVTFYVLPSAMAFATFGDKLVGAVYRTGKFDSEATLHVYLVLLGYTIGLMATTTTRVMSSALFALRDTRTPARTAALRVAVAAALGFGLMTLFEPIPTLGLPAGPLAGFTIGHQPLGAVGLTVGAGLAAWLEWAVLRRALSKQIGAVGASGLTLSKLGTAAVVGAVAANTLRWLLPALHPLIEATLFSGVFGLIYLGLAGALGVPEGKRFTNRLRRR